MNGVSQDQWRGTYLPAAAGVTAAAGAGAIYWVTHRGGH